jgi:hypothetical protein
LLRSELYELEKSVGALINYSTYGLTDYQKPIVEQVNYIKTLCTELKKKWTQELFSSAKEQIIKRYVQYHQSGITDLSDKVSKVIPGLNLSDELRNSLLENYRQLKSELENILDFLRKQFYQYFDIDHKATIYCCDLLKSALNNSIAHQNLYQSKTISNSLLEVILTSVTDIVDEGIFSGISYRHVEQVHNLLRLIQQSLQVDTPITTDTLVRTLYQQNFNSLHFFNWFQSYVSWAVAAITNKKEKQNYLGEQIKTYAEIFVSPEKSFQPELSSTNIYIIGWLEEQLGTGAKHRLVRTVEQFPLNLSVPQFALFVRIFYKTGCFASENVALITRFFTDHFTTKKQSHISRKSFGRAFYSLDQSAAAVVRDFLQKMINYLNKTYFP